MFSTNPVCLSQGIASGIQGPTLPYIIARVNSTYEGITAAFFTAGLGSITGGLIGGYLCTKYPRHRCLVMTLGRAMACGCILLVPWCRSVAMIALLNFITGLGDCPASASKLFVIKCLHLFLSTTTMLVLMQLVYLKCFFRIR